MQDMNKVAIEFKTLAEKIAKNLPVPCNILLNFSNPDKPILSINEWVNIELFLKEITPLSIFLKPSHVVHYSITHEIWSDKALAIDYVQDSLVVSPWEALKEAFKLILLNELETVINDVNEDEAEKDRKEYEEMTKNLN